MKNQRNTAYQTLQQHRDNIKNLSLRRLFEEDKQRVNRVSRTLNDRHYDFSKNHITAETIEHLTHCLLYTSPSPRDRG